MSLPTLSEIEIAKLCPDFSDISQIAQGGFKTVYRAKLGDVQEVIKVIAIPEIREENGNEAFRNECIRRVEREFDILKNCSSPFLVKTGSLGIVAHRLNDQDFVIYSEEYLDGPDLWTVLRNTDDDERPTEDDTKRLMNCLLLAIQEIWRLKVIHRDIKPCNVMKLDDPERPYVLLDLGIAFSLIETSVTYNAAYRDPPATFRYLAPEMGDPNFRANLDYRADLYTAALTVFEYASGEHPIARDGEDVVRTVTRALKDKPRSLKKLRPEFSEEFTSLIDQLLKKKPALRPANLKRLIQQTNVSS